MKTGLVALAAAHGLPLLMAALLHGAAATAADLALDPESTRVSIGLDSTLHRIEGTARLVEGSIAFDPAGGAASGRIVVDARSVDTGNALRDAQLHDKVLESERFPQIVFLPRALRVIERGPEQARVELAGEVEIHGSRHALAIPATVRREGENLRIVAAFDAPHVAWGMRDMSSFLLRVDPVTRVEVDAIARSDPSPARLAAPAAAAAR